MNISTCLKEAKKLTNNIIIVDSYSTDKTLEICKQNNCEIYQNIFINQANQLNWALENIAITSDWVIRLDADEYLTPELIDELKNKLHNLPHNINGVFFKRRVYFMDKWIKYGGYYPTLILRAWRNKKAICEERWMDEHMKLLEGDSVIFQYDFVDNNKKNLHWWINKHNNYATREAIEQLNNECSTLSEGHIKADFFGTQEQKKRWLKEKLYNKIPLGLKPFIYFIYRYIVRFGFLDGFRGLLFHVLQGFWYRFLVDAKVYEIKRKILETNFSMKEIIMKEYNIKL